MEWLRQRIEQQVLGLTGISLNEIDFEHPKGEPGLFGPQSAIWPVHGDFTSMLCGGISALLLQMLHPLALAGVWDHSNFREDIFGRLRRTSQFISATTYATVPDAERLIAKVKAIHLRVNGTDSDGSPYAASDPELLTWVHVAECSSFMASHLRYRRIIVTPSRQAQYFIESASIAERLGAVNVPKTPQAVANYLENMRPQLRCDERTQEVARVLMTTRLPGRLTQPAGTIFIKAGIDLLPPWAQEMLGLRLSPLEQRIVRGSVHAIAAVLRRSVRNGAYHCALRRMGR
ncbi:oxygenase MpaB family protein [Kluyvera sp. NPDC087067]|uniref:oxygenase MpaB family protein n=1 Tax=Kluyvera sp. NPDC087067 TaxID=3364105 RepID=UPI0038080BA8